MADITQSDQQLAQHYYANEEYDKALIYYERLFGKTPDEIADAFRREGYGAVVEQSTKGSKKSVQVRISGHKTIANIQVHPGGGIHSGPYIKISTSKWGKIKVVDPDTYREVITRNPVGGLNIEDATIIEIHR